MSAENRLPVLLDVDTGVDDALALLLACASDRLEIKAVTTVAGNVNLENTTRNTLNVLHLLGRGDIPVARGADCPLVRPLMKASAVHGLTGLRGYSFESDVGDALVARPAWELMRDILMQSREKLTIIAVGPLTNIALLLRFYPETQERIEKIVFMGTSYHDGNPTPITTFNVLVDPVAFRQVLFSGVPFYACLLDTTRKAYITQEEIDAIGTMGGEVARFACAILNGYGSATPEELATLAGTEDEEDVVPAKLRRDKASRTMHDPATVAFGCNPELFGWQEYYCNVECAGQLTTACRSG